MHIHNLRLSNYPLPPISPPLQKDKIRKMTPRSPRMICKKGKGEEEKQTEKLNERGGGRRRGRNKEEKRNHKKRKLK